jgi:hypothetical protein
MVKVVNKHYAKEMVGHMINTTLFEIIHWQVRVLHEAHVVEAHKLKSWARWTKCKLAWFRRTAEVIRLYLLQYDSRFSVNYIYFFPMAQQPQVGQGSSLSRLHDDIQLDTP